jgi:hypothetical protein
MPDRKKHEFPTRQYPYKKEAEITNEDIKIRNYSFKTKNLSVNEENGLIEPDNFVMRFIVGLDNHPKPLEFDELNKFDDSFANLILKRKLNPLTLNEVLNLLDESSNEENGLPNQDSFLAADGGQILWSQETGDLNRQFRFVVSRSDKNDKVQILISSSTVPDSKEQFLQLIGWDNSEGAYNFYERRGEFWFWAGNSFNALKEPTRGKGPFDSHVNGALVMKELKFPWVHWHSMTASINDDVLAPNDELRNERLWIDKLGGQEFEIKVAKPGVVKWNESRLKRNISQNKILKNCKDFFRQVIDTTTVNIVTSKEESKSIKNDSLVRIPETFFFNKDVLMDELGLEPNITPISFLGEHYISSLIDFEFHIGDSNFIFNGDTHFAFLVPETSFEDVNLISLLLSKKIVSKKFIASLLMIDFSNPIYSANRKELLKYFPDEYHIEDFGLEKKFKEKIENIESSLEDDSNEKQFLRNYNLPDSDWKKHFEKQIEEYFTKVKILIETKEGFYEIVKLAESRRREFRGTDLAEFRLTTPITNISENSPLLKITPNAIVQPKEK